MTPVNTQTPADAAQQQVPHPGVSVASVESVFNDAISTLRQYHIT
jgi:hypothetical protein